MRKTKEAFTWIVGILRKHKVHFQVSGGLAAKVYGSTRELFDIDIEMKDEKFAEVLPDVKKYVIFGPKRCSDKTFECLLLRIRYKNETIDLSGSESEMMFDKKKGQWVKNRINLSNAERKKVFGIAVPVISKKELIDYKQRTNRNVDICDLKGIRGIN